MRVLLCHISGCEARDEPTQRSLSREKIVSRLLIELPSLALKKSTLLVVNQCSVLGYLSLIAQAKRSGMVTSIVTNGSRITNQWLDDLNGNLDWVGLSIDTVDPEKLIHLGRAICGKIPITEEEYLETIRAIKQREIHLKINTVVTSVTWEEDFTPFIRLAQPERWKLLQALRVNGQNDAQIDDFVITNKQFETYVQRNSIVKDDDIKVVPENNEAMTESYVMIDPAGRFFDNAQGSYKYSDPILTVGVAAALKQISTKPERFYERDGKYEW